MHVDVGTLSGALRLQQRRDGLDLHRLVEIADLQPQVNADAVAGSYNDAFLFRLSKSGSLHGDRVSPRFE